MSPPLLLFTVDEWPNVIRETITQMIAKVAHHTTPISQVIANDHGEHLGTGSYCEFDGQRFLITNEHVAAERKTYSLADKFHGDDHYFRIFHDFHATSAPFDTALVRIDDCIWNHFPHCAIPIPPAQLASVHAPVEAELFFILGYSGERARFIFGTLITAGTPYLARGCPLPAIPECHPAFHFAMDYNPSLAEPITPNGRLLPLPRGMSGSLVWNTRVVEQRMHGLPWSADNARVTGIVWGWPSDTCIVATKVEHMQLQELVRRAGKLNEAEKDKGAREHEPTSGEYGASPQ